MKARFIFLSLFVFISLAGLKAQELISTAQGLSNRWATCLVQDDAGMMWIGTINGLNRYDGYEIKPYFTPQISNNNVICLLKDRSGLLWVGTGNGLNSIDLKTGNIVKITHPDQHNTLVVRSLFQRASGQVIICDQNGMVFTVTNTNKLVPLVKIPDVTATTNKLSSPVDYIREDKNKVLWFITEFGFIYRYDGKTLVSKNAMPTRIKYDYPKTLHIISTDTLLVGSRYSGLYYFAFRYNKRYTTPFLDSLNRISKLVYVTAEQEKDNYWITYVDLKVIKVNLAQNTILTNQYQMPEELNQTRAHHVYTGKEGTLWVCTDLGLWKIKPYNNSFTNHLTNTDNNLFNRVNNAYSMRALLPLKNNTMLVSTYKGFLTYDVARKTILKKILFPDRKVMRSAPFVRQMIEEPEGIWAVVEDGSLVMYDKNTQEFRLSPVTFRPDDMPIHDFFAVLKKEEQLWIGTTNGLYIYTISNGKYHEFATRLRGVSVYQLTRLMDHTVALSTSEGVFIAGKNGIVQQYTSMQLPSNEVNYTIQTDKDILYAGTSNGLCRINTQSHTIRSFTTSEGLCDNYINCIQKSSDGALWLSTNYGLSRFDPSNYSFVNFYKKNGLCENEFNRWSGATDEKGNLYFGTVNGLVSFDPLLYNASRKNIPDLFIASFTMHSNRLDSTITSAYFNPHHPLSLSVKDNFIEFGLGLTSYTDVQNNRYYYKLTRKQNEPGDWISVGNQNKVRLNNLVSGTYTLQFKGVNSEGYESGNIISFPLNISEVFYKTWWFISMEVLLISCLIFLVYKLRIRQLMKVQHIRTRIASDLHDEVGGVLARISIQSELLSRNNEPGNQQHEQLHRIAENSKHAIGMMSDVLWSIDARSDTLQNMLDRMRDFATVLDDKNIAYTFLMHTTDGGIQLASDKRQHIYLIFKEAITNMIKHSNATKASIELTVRSGVLILLIHDNGTISTPTKLPGQGLANMKMRAAKLHADLAINTTNGYEISLSCRI